MFNTTSTATSPKVGTKCPTNAGTLSMRRSAWRTVATGNQQSGLSRLARKWLLASTALLAFCAVSVPVQAQNSTETVAESSIRPVRGFLPDLRFELTGADGKTVTQNDLKGKVVLLFFGYANCPDICPTTMAQLAMVAAQLGDKASQVQIVFISVDPHRDTPERLQAYVSAFDTGAIGLSGTEKQIADIARRYRVAYQIEKPAPGAPDNVYEVAHGRGVYIFDQQGRARLLASDSESVSTLATKVAELL